MEEGFEGGMSITKTYLPIFLIGILCGVFATSLFQISILFVIGFCLLLLAMTQLKKKKFALIFTVFGVGLVGGFFRTDFALSKIEKDLPRHFEGLAVISSDPVQKENYQRIVFEPATGNDQECFAVVAFVAKYPILERSDNINVSCQLEKPENRRDDFNYVHYLAKDGIYRICASPKLTIVSAKKEGLRVVLAKTKNSFEKQIAKTISDPEASYLSGLLLGGSDRLPPDVAEAFALTGTTHTVAVSGYNITIIASAITLFLIFCGLWRKQAFWFAVFGIVAFVLLIGTPASAVRAAIMGILVLWAAKNGRLANSGRALLIAAATMVLWSPLILVNDVGFQLSFLATIGIIYIYGPLSEKLKIQNDFLELKSILLITISAQLGVLGIIIYNFETFSPISLIANVVILPAIPFIMLGGFVVILINYLIPWLAKLLGVVVWSALHLEIRAIELLAAISWSSIPVENVGKFWLVGYYVFFTGIAWQLNKRSFETKQKDAKLDLTGI